MDKEFEIYKLTNTSNNKIYIGITTIGVSKRFKVHCWKALEGSDYPLHKAIREYGKEIFRIEVLETTESPTIAREKEKYFIKIFNSQDASIGYNTTAGGEYFEVTDEMRKALSNAQKGRRHIESFKAVLQYTKEGEFLREYESLTDAEKLSGISRTSISRTLSKTLTKPSKTNPYIWVLKTEYPDIPRFIHPETIFTNLDYKPKMSEKCKQASAKYKFITNDFSQNCKQVTKYDIDGNKLETYISISDAAKKNNMTTAAIRLHLRGHYNYNDPKILKKLKFIWKAE